MKNLICYHLLILFLSLSLLSCRNKIEIERNSRNRDSVISLQIGNEYHYHWSSWDGENYSEAYFHKTIEKDTTINNLKYYIFDDRSILRSTADRVYSFHNSQDIILYDFSVDTGDVIDYQNYDLTVETISKEGIFDSTSFETKINASNESCNPVNGISVSYSTKFGLINFGIQENGKSSGYTLIGAKIGGTQYGVEY